MKSHPITPQPNMRQIEKVFNEQLNKAYISGLSNGAKIFAQVVKDKLGKLSDNNMGEVITDIESFVDTTLKSKVEELSMAFENVKENTEKIIKSKETK